MNKQDLIEAVAGETGISKADATRALDIITKRITQSLVQGEQVIIIGFGTFETSNRAARTGRNPRTGETIQIAASKVARFKAGKALKDQLNQ